jgi:5'-nucleotidase (lipoprotein e(P4) family)
MPRSNFLLALILAGAPLAGQTAAPSAPPVIADSQPLALQWYRTSAELRGLFIQTYRVATHELERRVTADRPVSWAVIMDADETVLDNSQYQMDRGGRGYSSDSWNAYVRSRTARALPGAGDFTKRVHALGGRVVVVTNRDSVVCPETIENLRNVGIAADEVLCKPANTDDKNPRFEAVQNGTAPSRLPALNVLMWFGDNIQDFPRLTQKLRGDPAEEYSAFGRIYFVLPNPLYGSWTKNKFP